MQNRNRTIGVLVLALVACGAVLFIMDCLNPFTPDPEVVTTWNEGKQSSFECSEAGLVLGLITPVVTLPASLPTLTSRRVLAIHPFQDFFTDFACVRLL